MCLLSTLFVRYSHQRVYLIVAVPEVDVVGRHVQYPHQCLFYPGIHSSGRFTGLLLA